MPSFKRKKLARKKLKKFKKKRKPLYKKKGFWIVLVVFSLIGFLVWALFFSSWFQIKRVEIQGAQTIEEKELIPVCEGLISKKILFFSTKSIFVVPSLKIENHLLQEFPKIKEVKVRRHFPSTMVVFVTERSPVFNFFGCNQFYLIDDQGIIFEEGKKENLSVIKNSQANECFLGLQALDKEKIEKLSFLVQHFYSQSKVKEIDINLPRIEIITDQEWKAIFSFEKDLEKQLKELEVIIEKKILPGNLSKLEYIDLRFNTISYKLKKQ